MPKPLVIVESPAKARTIAGFLGRDFVVMASMGHVRDLPAKGLSVDTDNGFKVDYEVNPSKKQVIKDLREALRDADELYLATDEDREGEAISWHLLEVLKPRVPVKRMVFHEITQHAIQDAVDQWREVDYGLVDAQESRRIVDRLFGYPVSEVCWRKIRTGLSAGRVQSPSVRLVVQRERERMAFVAAAYWDLAAAFPTDPTFTASLVAVDGAKVAEGKDFDTLGQLKRAADVLVLDEVAARGLAARLEGADFAVRTVETKPYTSRPKPPFITSSLQQVGGSRLRMSAQHVMRVAQGLYESGYITYMRTDSTTLSDTALAAARSQIGELFGREYLPDAPRSYTRKSKNAQEAHEAIRPAGEEWRTPAQLQGVLRGDDLRLYELIWQRTIASQMSDARGSTVTARIGATTSASEDTEWSASGRTITFPGYLAVYGFGGDDAEADGDSSAKLPELSDGLALPRPDIDVLGHATQPPARYTEATLVRALEERGIGRPSTYASIMQTIQDRGYVWKKGQALVPTTDAFAVVNLLERHFADLVDYDFTARMEDDLDEIAERQQQREPWLGKFWFGNGTPGVKTLCAKAIEEADPAEINAVPLGVDDDGEMVVVRNGKYGPYVKRGDDTASLPEGIALDELTIDRAVELLNAPKGDEPIGHDPDAGLPVYAKNGRFGPYVQLGDADTLPDGEKPKMASLFQSMSLETITLDDALRLLSLPRVVGEDDDGVEVVVANGRYGPYVKKGDETRSLGSEEQLFTVTLDEARAVLAQPKQFGRSRSVPAPPLRELGNDPSTDKPIVVKDGRFGPYVTDGETNASLRKGDAVEGITVERASELLQIRRETAPTKPKRAAKKAASKKKPAAKKKAPAKAIGARKAPAKRTAAKGTVAETGANAAGDRG
ncbi:MAG TPA: type I DNA topoisomerase [Acidimicrobiales bacterium]|jgi:DNA topoisomerase-1|nr:type I DNA topoisomerase [Acidimicrobiales bacterium]